MSRPTPLIDWQPQHGRDWNQRPLCLQHRLHESPLFQPEALAALIERTPPERYALVQTNRSQEGQRRWREGVIGQSSGQQVMAAIARGDMWLNLRRLHEHEPGFAALVEQIYAELGAAMPGFSPGALNIGILISSPNIQVHYHVDLPGQMLWQIAGRKRVYVYPPQPPFLSPQALEDIAYSGFEFKLGYDRAFDRQAVVLELEPGQALSWPLNSPHRIDNHDCLNISFTTEHWTADNRRSQQVSLANAVLRHRLGVAAPSRRTQGPGFWGKWALQAAWRRSPWAQRTQARERPIEFRLDPQAEGLVQDLGPSGR